MSEKKRAGFSRLQKMSTYDDLIEQASEDKKITLDRIGPKLSNQNEVEIPIEELHTFPDHPFKVIDDEAMQSLADSIGNRGVLHPIVVRVDPKGGYQIISGHRRRFACEKAGLKTVPAYIVEIDDDEAIILMTDANFYQREGLLPSEKAKAYRMKSDAIKRHQGASTGKHTIDEIGEGTSDSSQDKEPAHGKMKLSELVGQGQGASSIEVTDNNIKSFEKVAKKYNVDFAVKKDKTLDPPRYMVFFKAKDTDVISQAFKEFVKVNEKQKAKVSVKQKLKDFAKVVAQNKNRERTREKHKDRGQSL